MSANAHKRTFDKAVIVCPWAERQACQRHIGRDEAVVSAELANLEVERAARVPDVQVKAGSFEIARSQIGTASTT